MSGASALAAAKRRRAVPAEPTRPTSTQPKTTQLPKPAQPSVSTNVQQPAQNPLQLLIQHEQRIIDIEREMNKLKLDEKKPDTLMPDTLQYFKTQQELMSQEIQELKKIIIKVQTFSMETNLDLIKIKKSLKLIDSNETA
jgi:hypothetical protein